MTSQEPNLSAEQTELVAVGAGVGAGCKPCITHHLKAGAEAGLGGEQLLAAVASAERVSAEATVAIGDHARAELDANVTSAALLSRLEEALASLGAALGANDPINIERQLRAAADLGASRSQLHEALDIAHTVQENAARAHLREAERLLDALTPETAPAQPDADPGGGCGCIGMADRFAASDTSGAMTGCRENFERFMSAVSPAETDRAPAAATVAGGCKKEA